MEDSPAKRRKISPRTSVPINAPTPPSRIPVRTDGATTTPGRPSFASPTKASISRHNPQLLNAPSTAGTAARMGSRGRNLDDVFAKALGQKTGLERGDTGNSNGDTEGSTTQENEPRDEARPQTPSFRAGMAGRPRRLSRSPVKQPESAFKPSERFETIVKAVEEAKVDPFQKRAGLRRSPPAGSQEVGMSQESANPLDGPNPFQKTTRLRLSPPAASQERTMSQESANPLDGPNPFQPRTTGLRRSNPSASQERHISQENATFPNDPFSPQKRVLRRSPPTASQDVQVVRSQDSANPLDGPNPFQRTNGLRRSDPTTSQEIPVIQESSNPQTGPGPFQKRSLVRPPPSQPLEVVRQASLNPDVTTTPTDTPPHREIQVARNIVTAPNDPSPEVKREESTEPGAERSIAQATGQMRNSPNRIDERTNTDLSPGREVRAMSSSPRRPPRYMLQPPVPTLGLDRNMSHMSSSPRRPPRASQASPIIMQSIELEEPTPSKPRPSIEFGPLLPSPSKPQISREAAAQKLSQPVVVARQLQETPRHHSKFQKPAAPRSAMNDEYEEPELPPTPTERGISDPIVTTPPAGIHDTPSRRAKRNKALGHKLKSSPLKPRDSRPKAGASKFDAEAEQDKGSEKQRSARLAAPQDPDAAKKKARDGMLKELQQLQADVSLTIKENERLRLHYESSNAPPKEAKNQDELDALLLRALISVSSSQVLSKPKTIFQSIGSFLPFSSRRKSRVRLPPPSDKPLPSHLPVAIDTPLPHLQACSSLTCTSSITLLPPNPSDDIDELQIDTEPPMQLHRINLTHKSGLFSARLSMVVNSSLLSVHSFDIQRLDPSAEKELGPFIRAGPDQGTSISKEIGVVYWAIGRWVEVSILRARLWCTIAQELGTPEVRRKSVQQKKKRKARRMAADKDANLEDGQDENDEMRKHKWSKSQLLPFMGKSAVEIVSEEVELRFEWKIDFDWTGEVDSVLSASARVPRSWKRSDDRNSLAKVPESFGRLVKQMGPLAAVRTIVGLLMPTEA